ncbi:MAG: prepilin-type N-terminal cleavage/methylation domain-containing protein [Patescibacteria group bacterium]|nr:prepilin-type N-terminal cleavage/methylation domain-containing protein [Patescibacteria group bacterium]
MNDGKNGFTMIEILVAIAIILILVGIGVFVFYEAREKAELDGITDGIASTLEKAQSNALNGGNGLPYGVRFQSNSYTYFSGNSYDPSDPSDVTVSIDSGHGISDNISGDTVIFSRLTGVPDATGTVTVTDLSSDETQTVTIGNQGDITVVK